MKSCFRNLLKLNFCTTNWNKSCNNTFIIRVLHAYLQKSGPKHLISQGNYNFHWKQSHMIMSLKVCNEGIAYIWLCPLSPGHKNHVKWFSWMQLHISSRAEQFQIFTLWQYYFPKHCTCLTKIKWLTMSN